MNGRVEELIQSKDAPNLYWALGNLPRPLVDIREHMEDVDSSGQNRAYQLQVRGDRQSAALQTIEAVRMYAANHDGKLPPALKDITEAPAPIDPVTGKVFDYKPEGNTFILNVSVPPGMSARNGRRYIVTLKK